MYIYDTNHIPARPEKKMTDKNYFDWNMRSARKLEGAGEQDADDSTEVILLSDYEVPEFKILYEKIEGSHWVPEEINYSGDASDWKVSIDEDTKTCVKQILTFFSQADFLVVDIISLIEPHVKNCPYVHFYIIAQKAQEHVHAITYMKQIVALGLPQRELQEIFQAFKKNPDIDAIAKFIEQEVSEANSAGEIGKLILIDAFVEGILFQGAFAAIQWLRTKNVLKGVTKANEFITRDEGLHTEAICAMFKFLRQEYRTFADGFVNHLCDIFVGFADKIAADCIKVGLVGLTRDSMRQYIRFHADIVLQMLGYEPLYNASNPYESMVVSSMNQVIKTNFFEVESHYTGTSTDSVTKIAMLDEPIDC